MAEIGTVTGINHQKPILSVSFSGIASGDHPDVVFVGGWPNLITAYFIWPADLVSGMAQLIVSHDKDYAGDWALFGPEPDAVANAVRTIQVPGQGVEYLGVRVTTDIVTSPTGGLLTVKIVGS